MLAPRGKVIWFFIWGGGGVCPGLGWRDGWGSLPTTWWCHGQGPCTVYTVLAPASPEVAVESFCTLVQPELYLWYPEFVPIVHARSYFCCYSDSKSCPTLCNPLDWGTPSFPDLLYLLKFVQSHVHWVPDGASDKESACNAGDPGLIPGSQRSPGEGNDYSL